MKAVIQRVSTAEVWVEKRLISRIDTGILTLLGIEKGDTKTEVERIISKILHLRIFEDENGKMNLSLKDVGGKHLIISQFTLAADCQKGNRPSFDAAEHANNAQTLYNYAIRLSESLGINTLSGEFGASMQIKLINDGPATFILSTSDKKGMS